MRLARPSTPLLQHRRHVWGLLAMALLVGAVIALAWADRAHPGVDLLGYPYSAAEPDAEGTKQRLLLSILSLLAVCGLFGVVAWLADVQSARMTRGGRRRLKHDSAHRKDHGVG